MIKNDEKSRPLPAYPPRMVAGRRQAVASRRGLGQQGDTRGGEGVSKLYTFEGLDSEAKRPVSPGHETNHHINELERAGEREDIWHDLCFIAGREGLLESKGGDRE
jgi:hypothetical protein